MQAQADKNTLTLQGRRILVVEDEALLAMDLKDCLEKAGASVVGPVGRLERALKIAEHDSADAALLDVDLNGQRCWPVADALVRRGIPFVFTTGFSSSIVVPERLRGHRMLAKPYREADILTALGKLLGAVRS